MGASEQARSLAFWTLDRLHGGRVLFHMRDLERLDAHPELLAARQAEQLENILSHACRTTAYYRQFEGARDLRDFPLLSKRTIRERHDDLISSAYPPEALRPRSSTTPAGPATTSAPGTSRPGAPSFPAAASSGCSTRPS
jgi:hypothetical protein